MGQIRSLTLSLSPTRQFHLPKLSSIFSLENLIRMFNQRTLAIEGRITVQLVSSLTRLELTNEGNIILFVFSEAVESNLVILETSRTVILFTLVSVLRVYLCQATLVHIP